MSGEPLYELHARPDLEHPVLLVALEGWIDAGLGAGAAIATLLATVQTEVVATFDADRLLDHRARRPVLRIVDGINTALMWPEIQVRGGLTRTGQGVLLLIGPEPDHEWRAFANAVAEIAGAFDARLLVGLGAFPAPAPHTRPSRLAATASSEELAHQIGFVPGTLDVPAGVQAALERRIAELGVPAVGLWARVPHYAAAMPYPEASAVLLEGLASLTGIEVDSAELRRAAVATRQRLDELIANSQEHIAMVRQLEEQVDAEASSRDLNLGTIPSGDEIAAELERFLRDESAG
jgi:proteasome assembly chaperone (PAC2) family protein